MRFGRRKVLTIIGGVLGVVALLVSYWIGGLTWLLLIVGILQLVSIALIAQTSVISMRHIDVRITQQNRKLTPELDRFRTDNLCVNQKLHDTIVGLIQDLADQAPEIHKQTEQRVISRIRATDRENYRQIEALLALYHDILPRRAYPPLRGWTAGPDILHYLYRRVVDDRIGQVVELGSGASTVVMAYALAKLGRGRLVSIEHDEHFRDATVEMLHQHGLGEWVDVRMAPLKEIKVGDENYLWYSPSALSDSDEAIELLFVDGPPGNLQPYARYPALPLIYQRLAANSVIVVDDYIRDDEKEVVARWLEEYPEFVLHQLQHEKRTAVLEGGRASGFPALK